MNVEQSMCASSGPTSEWDRLRWSVHERRVRRLQARIVKATREGRWGKVKSLQWLLTHSFSGKALAVRRVTGNQGKNTPGVDGETWNTPARKYNAIGMMRRRGYQPRPLRRVYIPKSNGKLRPLGIPTMRDRAMQALHLLALEPIAETLGDSNSYGFRSKRSTADAMGQLFIVLGRRHTAKWVLEGDIQACFDKISHSWMLTYLPTDREVLAKWLRAGFVEKRTWFPMEAGTPQGGIISPTLMNLTLNGLEQLLQERFPNRRVAGRQENRKVNLVRYADDFIITGESKETLQGEVRPLVEQFLNERGLRLSPEKTTIIVISEGFDFLGQNIRCYGETLLIKPSKKNTQAFYEKVRSIIQANCSASQANMIRQLNPVIRGWANYHRHVSAGQTFAKMDHLIWRRLWRWAKRRHPYGSRRWRYDRYWHSIAGNKWTFAVDTGERTRNGSVVWLRLERCTATRHRRHIKVRSDANPFDPKWDEYYAQRELRMRWPAKPSHREMTPVAKTGPT